MKKILRLLAAFLIIGVSIVSCEKDEFTEKDALTGQEDLITIADSLQKEFEILRDSLARIGGVVNYTVNVINAGNAGFMKASAQNGSLLANGLNGVTVTTSQLGVVSTKQTNDQGMVVFSDLRIGKVVVNISLANYTSVSYVAELTPDVITNITQSTIRSAATQVPIFPLTGSATTTVSGLITYETDLTNGTPEKAASVPISASIDVNNTFINTYVNTGGNNGTGEIIKIAYGDAVVSGTTDANGLYSLRVPTTASGLPIRVDVSDLAVTQSLLTPTLYEKDVFGVQTVRTIFSQNTGAPSFIPTVRPAYVTFGAPTGTVVGGAPTTAATAVAVLSKGEIESINITNNGEGYTQVPMVKITGNGTGATATATLTNGRVTAIVVNTKGQDYSTATISLTETGGINATASAVLSKKLKSVAVNTGGSNYTAAPTITITGDGTGATVVPKMNGYVSKINVTNVGGGYTTDPIVTISGGGGVGATATASLTTGNLRSITVPADANAWYTVVPVVSFLNHGGAEAPAATAVLDINGRVSGITINVAGLGYTTPPAITFTSTVGSGAVAVAVLGAGGAVASVVMVEKGSGYSSATPPTVSIASAPAGGTSASISVANIERRIASVNVTTPGAGFTFGTGAGNFDGSDVLFGGSAITGTQIKLNRALSGIAVNLSGNDFTSAPTVVITGDNTTTATATAEVKYSVENIIVTNQGSGYTNTPTVVFTGDGSGATATATLGDAYISKVVLGNSGSGYTAVPYVEITGGGTPDENAIVAAVLNGDKVESFTITQPGKGYGSAPTVTIKTYKTSASASANFNSGSVAAISVTNPGLGYSVAPIVEFVSTSGTGAVATAVLDGQGRIQQINVTSAGSGYVTAPTVNLVVPNAVITATGHVVVDAQGIVTGVVVDDGGNGYIAVPAVTILPSVTGIGSGAIAIARISGGKVTSVVVTNGGTGYKGQNTPGNFYPINPANTGGMGYMYSQPSGATLDMKSGTPIINDIYLGTGLRTIEQ
ncbi:MAG: beta strand repeat-containing protein [Tenuifilaceae bacterium]